LLDFGFYRWLKMYHYLMLGRLLGVAFLFFFSSAVFADTYTAVPFRYEAGLSGWQSSASAACSANDSHYPSSAPFTPSGAYCNDKNGMAYFGLTTQYDCPYGGTLSGSSCINAPACPAGQTRNSSGACVTPPKACPSGEYNPTPSTCAPIPSCQTETTGQYFDVNSGGCVSPQCPETGGVCDVKACEDTTKFYCAPTDNCKSSGSTCSNDPDEPDATKEQRDAQIAADRAAADSDAATAAAAKDAAAKSAADQAAAAATADAEQKAAETAAKDASKTQAERDAAAQAFIDKARESLAKHEAANNSNESSRSAASILQSINALNGLLHDVSVIDGNSDTLAKQINDLLKDINQALTDAINGYPRGKDTPPDANHPCPVNQNCDGEANGHVVDAKGVAAVPPTDNHAEVIAAKRVEFQSMVTGIKSDFQTLKPTLAGGGGSFSCGAGVMLPVVNVAFEVCLVPYIDAFMIMGGAVFFAAVVASVFVILG
jgi:hypothetical protein